MAEKCWNSWEVMKHCTDINNTKINADISKIEWVMQQREIQSLKEKYILLKASIDSWKFYKKSPFDLQRFDDLYEKKYFSKQEKIKVYWAILNIEYNNLNFFFENIDVTPEEEKNWTRFLYSTLLHECKNIQHIYNYLQENNVATAYASEEIEHLILENIKKAQNELLQIKQNIGDLNKDELQYLGEFSQILKHYHSNNSLISLQD